MTSRPDEEMPTVTARGRNPAVPPPAPPPEEHVHDMRGQGVAQGDVLYGRFSLVGTARSHDCRWQMFSSCFDGYGGLRGHSLRRRLVCSTGTDFKGLETGRSAVSTQRPHQRSDGEKRLLALEAAFNVVRHIRSVRAERLLAELDAEVHVKNPDPASYTTDADAATRAATAVPAPVPSVHAVQIPHVHVVQKHNRDPTVADPPEICCVSGDSF